MKTRSSLILGLTTALLLFGAAASFAQPAPQPIFHDPWLNWDFINLTGGNANDFDIIVENPAFNPNPNDPSQVLLGAPFLNFSATPIDRNGDLVNDATRLRWSNPLPGQNPIVPNQRVHVGGDMRNSGKILDAYWTNNGAKVGASIAISYERTMVVPGGSADIHMILNIAPGFYAEQPPGTTAGWTGIRTFMDIPASLLGLQDLNKNLDLSTLAFYETEPHVGSLAGPVIHQSDPFLFTGLDSFFDVYVGHTPNNNPNYESLLYAVVLDPAAPIGWFWNLNPQSPEPAALALLALGALALGALALAGRRSRRN